MKRKEPGPSVEFSEEVASSCRSAKRPKLAEDGVYQTNPIPEAVLERFADAGRRQLQFLVENNALSAEAAMNEVLGRLVVSHTPDQAPSYSRADVKMVKKITGFDFTQAERVLQLREEILWLSKELKTEPALAVDALTTRLLENFHFNPKKRNRDEETNQDMLHSRPPKRIRESQVTRPGKRSFSDVSDTFVAPNTLSASFPVPPDSSVPADSAAASKRRKLQNSDKETNGVPSPANSGASVSENLLLPASAEPPSFLSRVTSTFRDSFFRLPKFVTHSVAAASQVQMPTPSFPSFDAPTGAQDSPMYSTESKPPDSIEGCPVSPLIPAVPLSTAGKLRARLSELDSFDDASSFHSDDRSTTSSMIVHASHSVDGNLDDGIADDTSSCGSTTSSAPSRKSKGTNDDSSSTGAPSRV